MKLLLIKLSCSLEGSVIKLTNLLIQYMISWSLQNLPGIRIKLLDHGNREKKCLSVTILELLDILLGLEISQQKLQLQQEGATSPAHTAFPTYSLSQPAIWNEAAQHSQWKRSKHVNQHQKLPNID